MLNIQILELYRLILKCQFFIITTKGQQITIYSWKKLKYNYSIYMCWLYVLIIILIIISIYILTTHSYEMFENKPTYCDRSKIKDFDATRPLYCDPTTMKWYQPTLYDYNYWRKPLFASVRGARLSQYYHRPYGLRNKPISISI
jgi:hypothetical protein